MIRGKPSRVYSGSPSSSEDEGLFLSGSDAETPGHVSSRLIRKTRVYADKLKSLKRQIVARASPEVVEEELSQKDRQKMNVVLLGAKTVESSKPQSHSDAELEKIEAEVLKAAKERSTKYVKDHDAFGEVRRFARGRSGTRSPSPKRRASRSPSEEKETNATWDEFCSRIEDEKKAAAADRKRRMAARVQRAMQEDSSDDESAQRRKLKAASPPRLAAVADRLAVLKEENSTRMVSGAVRSLPKEKPSWPTCSWHTAPMTRAALEESLDQERLRCLSLEEKIRSQKEIIDGLHQAMEHQQRDGKDTEVMNEIQMRDLREALADRDYRLGVAQEELVELREVKSTMQQDYGHLKEKHKKALAAKDERVSELESLVADLRDREEKLEKIISQKENQSRIDKRNLKEVKAEAAHAGELGLREKEALEAKILTLEGQLAEEVRMAVAERKSLRGEIESLESSLKDARTSFSEASLVHQDQLKTAERYSEERKYQAECLMKQVADLTEANQQYSSRVKSLDADIRKLEHGIEEARDHVAKEAANHMREVKYLQKEIAMLAEAGRDFEENSRKREEDLLSEVKKLAEMQKDTAAQTYQGNSSLGEGLEALQAAVAAGNEAAIARETRLLDRVSHLSEVIEKAAHDSSERDSAQGTDISLLRAQMTSREEELLKKEEQHLDALKAIAVEAKERELQILQELTDVKSQLSQANDREVELISHIESMRSALLEAHSKLSARQDEMVEVALVTRDTELAVLHALRDVPVVSPQRTSYHAGPSSKPNALTKRSTSPEARSTSRDRSYAQRHLKKLLAESDAATAEVNASPDKKDIRRSVSPTAMQHLTPRTNRAIADLDRKKIELRAALVAQREEFQLTTKERLQRLGETVRALSPTPVRRPTFPPANDGIPSTNGGVPGPMSPASQNPALQGLSTAYDQGRAEVKKRREEEIKLLMAAQRAPANKTLPQ